MESKLSQDNTAAEPTRLHVDGMTCNNCASKVRQTLSALPGVDSVHVRLELHQAEIRWGHGQISAVDHAIAALQAAGYASRHIETAVLPTSQQSKAASLNAWLGGWGISMLLGVTVFLILLVGESLLKLGGDPVFRWASFVLAGLVQWIGGGRFYRGAWSQAKAGQANMDTLVSLGSTAAFAYSLWRLIAGTGDHLFFMESAGIIALISVGHWLEGRISARAEGALKELLALAPEQAVVVNPVTSEESVVHAAQLKPGSWILIRPGQQIAADGVVLQGESTTQESMLTGESKPVDKKRGQPVYRGTLNLDGQIVVQVTAAATGSVLARIAAAVERAQNSQASIQRLGDAVSRVFVPVVVLIAITAGLGWAFALGRMLALHDWLQPLFGHGMHFDSPASAGIMVFAAVLIVACPCAMGLATPVALMAAANAAARDGVLIRDGIALEKAGVIDTVVFDKTGTLTEGSMTLAATEHYDASPTGRETFANLASSLAGKSAHPISKAVARPGTKRVPLVGFHEWRGQGLEARVRETDEALLLGSIEWLQSRGVDTSPGVRFRTSWTGQGATVIGFAVQGRFVAAFAVADELKSGAAEVVNGLRKRGIEVRMITGDHATTAAAIAARCGIEASHIHAGATPEGKADLIADLQKAGRRVAFVGDGINDSPALTQANLGVAVTKASDVARESADLLLLRSDIQKLPRALELAQSTLRIIHQNLFWAFFYNALSVPLAALGFLSPLLCALSMGLSDLIVVGNSLRLMRRCRD